MNFKLIFSDYDGLSDKAIMSQETAVWSHSGIWGQGLQHMNWGESQKLSPNSDWSKHDVHASQLLLFVLQLLPGCWLLPHYFPLNFSSHSFPSAFHLFFFILVLFFIFIYLFVLIKGLKEPTVPLNLLLNKNDLELLILQLPPVRGACKTT